MALVGLRQCNKPKSSPVVEDVIHLPESTPVYPLHLRPQRDLSGAWAMEKQPTPPELDQAPPPPPGIPPPADGPASCNASFPSTPAHPTPQQTAQPTPLEERKVKIRGWFSETPGLSAVHGGSGILNRGGSGHKSRRGSLTNSIFDLNTGKRFSQPGTENAVAMAFRKLSKVHAEKVELSPWRMKIHRMITENRWFDRVTLTLIMINCVFLAMEDPTDKDNKGQVNKIVNISEYVFAACFTIEMAIRIAGLGLYKPSFAYLRDAWNILDAIIVISGLATIVVDLTLSSDGGGAGLSGLRAFRLLRPLRAVTKIKEVRVIIASLLHSLPKLADVLLLFFFFILIFGVIGVQLWKGGLDDRCLPTNGTEFLDRTPIPEEDADRVCGTSDQSGYRCPWGYTCTALRNKNMGRTSFDNILWALLTLFVAVTMEGWTDVMYFVQDSYSWWYCLYFVVLILFGSFFVMNLVLVMIGVAYLDVEHQEAVRTEQEGKEDARRRSRVQSMEMGTLLEELGEGAISEGTTTLDAIRWPGGGESLAERCSTGGPGPGGNASAGGAASGPSSGFQQSQVQLTKDALASAGLRRGGGAATVTGGIRMKNEFLKELVKEQIYKKWFTWLITCTILLNTLFMAIEHRGQDDAMTTTLEYSNFVFTGVFALESLLKIYALTWDEFVSDRFNVFDAVVALIALVDVLVLQQQTSQQTGVSVLRTFRLLRMFKLAKQFPTLWTTALTIIRSVEGVSVITLLLILVIFIYALLGKQFFGGRFCGLENPEDYVPSADDYCVDLPRSNFDHLGWATLSVFQVITGEDWNVVMYYGMCAGTNDPDCSGNPGANNWYSLYFVSLFVLGNYVVLNLFIAVLISNFSSSRQRGENVREWTDFEVMNWLETVSLPGETESAGLWRLKDNFDTEINKVLIESIDGEALLGLQESQLDSYLQIDELVDRVMLWKCITALRIHQANWEDEHRSGCSYRVKQKVNELDRALQRSPPGEHVEAEREETTITIEDEEGSSPKRRSVTASPRRGGVQTLLRLLALPNPPSVDRVNSAVKCALEQQATEEVLRQTLVEHWGWRDDPPGFPENDPPNYHKLREHLVQLLNSKGGHDISNAIVPECSATFSRLTADQNGSQESMSGKRKWWRQWFVLERPAPEPYNVALGFLPSTLAAREWLRGIVLHNLFESLVISLILLSTAALAMNNPIAAPDARIPQALDQIDLFLTIAFDVEAFLKIVAHGFLLAPESYLRRDAWNRLDFVIVVVSNLTLAMQNASGTEQLALLRMMRTLRPLRFINRFPGLKLVVVSLVKAIPPLANIFLVTLLVFVIFGIMGVQFFSGTFAQCSNEAFGDTGIMNEEDCLPPNRWGTGTFSYDNLYEALVALFQMATLEGWVAQMHMGMDGVPVARGEFERAGVKNQQPWMSVYFVVFIVVGCFFVVNLFIGVLIEQYNSAKNANERDQHQGLTEDQRLWVEVNDVILDNVPPVLEQRNIAEWRLLLREQVMAPWFEGLVTMCIVVNVGFMGTEHNGQGVVWETVLDVADFVFIGVFTVEAILKWLALGLRGYFGDQWNRFDFSILVVSLIGASISLYAKGAPILSVFRALRLGRLTRVIRTATGVRALLRTLWLSLPGLTNVAGLLLLFFFLYAVVGVVVFGRVQRGQCLTDQVNFDSFADAMLLLFRMSTGEAWQCLMFDCEVAPPYCDEQLGNCGSKAVARLYFISFMALTFHVLLQVFIAIILSDYENVANEMNADVTEDDIIAFTEEWNKRDPRGRRLFPTPELPIFLRALERCPGPPLGFANESDPMMSVYQRKFVLRVLGKVCTDYDGQVFFQDVLLALVEHNVLAKKWNTELGMDIPDKTSWQIRTQQYSKRWHALGYRRPRARIALPVSDCLAALKIQTAWRAKKGRERAVAKADGMGRPVTWRMNSGLSMGANQRKPSVEAPTEATTESMDMNAPLPGVPTVECPDDDDEGAESADLVAHHHHTVTPDQICTVDSDTGSDIPPLIESPTATGAAAAAAPPPLAGCGGFDESNQHPPLGPPHPPPAPPRESASGSAAAAAAPPQRAQSTDYTRSGQGSSTNAPPPPRTRGTSEPPRAAAGLETSESESLKNVRQHGQGVSYTTTSTRQESHGSSNITIHNISIHNINIGSGQQLPSLPPELVAQLQRQAAQQQEQGQPGQPTAHLPHLPSLPVPAAARATSDSSGTSANMPGVPATGQGADSQISSPREAPREASEADLPRIDSRLAEVSDAASPMSQCPAASLEPAVS
eukprot:Hpha_TRINITY_DN15647_c4_g2::TRINITY_DN15647_c4_g2_i1::g.101185::m.101185/K04838/SCN5A; voltage-gated sodium channel type V alpha